MAGVDEPFEPVTGTRRLAVGQQCVATVAAIEPWYSTGVFVDTGETYILKAVGVWTDRKTSCGPAGYASPNILMRWFEWSRRVRGANWFALIGAVDRASLFPIGDGTTLETTRRGVLFCFANDTPGFYRNNSGFVTLTIERTA
jgi:hypothetical protein